MIDREFLFPTTLQVSPTPLSKVLFVGSCLIENMIAALGDVAPETIIDYVMYNNLGDLPDTTPSDIGDYQFQYLQIPLFSLISEHVEDFANFTEETRRRVKHDALDILDLMLDAGLRYNRESGLVTLVANFLVPQSPIASSLKDAGTENDLVDLVRQLNSHLAASLAMRPNVFLADLDAIASSMGKAGVMDDWHHMYAHNATFLDWHEWPGPPFQLQHQELKVAEFRPSRSSEFFQLAWRQAESLIRTVLAIDQVKLVIFDLDNTLWRGQIAEHYNYDVVWPEKAGWPQGLAEAVQHLRARGILVAICSKNDEKIVEDNWSRPLASNVLSLDHFIIRKINWNPKAENIAEILGELSLTPKSVVFVDDSPVERAAVKAAFPEIRVIGDNQFLTRNILLRAPETQRAVLTDESKRREGMTHRQLGRERDRAALSRKDFLAGLKCKIECSRVSSQLDANFQRALELVNRTNQFNTTGRRWTASEFFDLFRNGGYLIAMHVVDRFAAYGLVGVLIVRESTIEQFVMSCRVLGLGIEKAAIAVAIDDIRLEQPGDEVTAILIENKDNFVCRGVYQENGFSTNEDGAGQWVYRGPARDLPSHIELSEKKELGIA